MSKCPKCGRDINHLLVVYKEKGITDLIGVGESLPMGRVVMKKEFRCPECGQTLTNEYEEALLILGIVTGDIA